VSVLTYHDEDDILTYRSGADVSISRKTPPGVDVWRHGLKETVANNLNNTQAFYSHSKILVTALNGPVIGIAAALVSFSDFIYCVCHTHTY
jgi:peroxisomal 3,2-trans-enoyl-CoA isomerase